MTLALAAPPSRPPDAAPAAFWQRLAEHGHAPALVTAEGPVSYADLAGRVADLVSRLGTTRRLVLLHCGNDVESVVGYLACLVGGHPVVLTGPEQSRAAAGLLAAYDPDAVLAADGLTERRPGSRHRLHPDLAVLLSTSGSTGSPKLVRLSHAGLAANAGAIAASLGIRADDVAATTLPLHYCYGLSVLNSHLARGAAVLLTSASVLDPGFWDLFRAAGATTFPGVPHTFDLLDRSGFAERDLPSLRYVTQAGGRLEPDAVRRFAELGRRRGWDLVVMYGATEATARMAWLPPALASAYPDAIGIPIPGGSFRIDPVPGGGPRSEPEDADRGCGPVGELVYAGENVMLGYAESPADLARGRDVHELRTGDLARRTGPGLYQVVGRISRTAKVFGLRVDLDRVERVLADAGVVATCADAGTRVVVAVDSSCAPVEPEAVRGVLRVRLDLPERAVRVVGVPGIPRLASGKPDYPAVAALATEPAGAADGRRAAGYRGAEPGEGRPSAADLAGLYASVLGVARVSGTDSFVSLHGDSLSYVELSLRLEERLGRLPADWHRTPVADLVATEEPAPRRRRGRTVETNVLLRAVAIVLVVGSHANLFTLLGGAHVLFAVSGFNFGRFHLTAAARAERVAGMARSLARIVVPSVLWLALVATVSAKYGLLNVLLLNGLLGPRHWAESWHYWYVEALVATLVLLTLAAAVPALDRLERRLPFWLPMGLAVAFLLPRYEVVGLLGGDRIHRAHVIFWLFALGWAAVKAEHHGHRLLVSAVAALSVPGFFPGQTAREYLVVVGVLLLVWVPSVRVPAPVARPAAVLASASLYVYLCHWQIYPHLEFRVPLLATLLSLAAGVALWWAVSRATPYVERRLGPEIRRRGRWFTPRRCAPRDHDPSTPEPARA